MEIEFKAVGGHWAAVSVDAVSDGQVFMHVGVCVGGFDEFAAEDLDVSLVAGDQQLGQLARPGADRPLAYGETKAITAIGDFVFANPDAAPLTAATVTLLGESVAWDLSDPGAGPPLIA